VAQLGQLPVPRTERAAGGPSGIQARLRSALLVRGWGKKPEPRVRFGQPFLPGLAQLGPEHRLGAAPVLARAAAVRDGRFTYLGHTVTFDDAIEWSPRGTSEAWRTALQGLDDVVALGIAAALAASPDERLSYWHAATGLLNAWLTSGRPGNNVAAQARRIVSLIHLHACFAAELRADPHARRALLDTLYGDAVGLAVAAPRQPSEPSLVAVGRALFMAGRFFDGMEAREWLDAGTALLWAQLREQVHEDGGHRDRCPAWHAFALTEYLEVLAILRASNDDVPMWGRKRIKGMADFLARVMHPDGTLPLLAGAPVEVRPPREILATAAVVLHESAFALPGELPGVWPLLVAGESGRRVYASLPRGPLPLESRALRRTGYYVLAGGTGDAMFLDGGTPRVEGAAGGFPYELSVGGRQLIVGPGAPADPQHALAGYAASTRARNVLIGRTAATATPLRTAGVESETHWAVRDGLVFFSGIDHAVAEIRHRRCVFCLPGRFWIVCDELDGSGLWEGESLVHLHPETRVKAMCDGHPRFIAGIDERAWVSVIFAGADEVRLSTGVDGPRPQGWHGVAPGSFRPAPTIALATRGTLPLVSGYALLPRNTESAELAFERDAFQLRASLRVGAREYQLTVVQNEVELVVSS
jgi:hypothetical protein